MKKIITIICVLCLVVSCCNAEESTIHNLWNIDLNKMDVQQVRDYLDQEKGILSSIVWNYDKSGHNSLNTLDDQNITLFDQDFSLHYTEYKWGKTILLSFDSMQEEKKVWDIVNQFTEKYGSISFAYYEIYTQSIHAWKGDICTPMYHDLYILESSSGFEIDNALNNWEHMENDPYDMINITLYLLIDNIEIKVKHNHNGWYTLSIDFYSKLLKTDAIEELHETKNMGNYVDTGL